MWLAAMMLATVLGCDDEVLAPLCDVMPAADGCHVGGAGGMGGRGPTGGHGGEGGSLPDHAHCINGVRDAHETDVDCGGHHGCLACDDGLHCIKDTDCRSGVCENEACACKINHVVISEVQTNGPNGRQFVELWNGSPVSVALDNRWYLVAQAATGNDVVVLWQGHEGMLMKPWSHYLITSPTWGGFTPEGDDALMATVPSGLRMELLTFDGENKATVDGLCAYRTDEDLAVLTAPFAGCEGSPVHNPADGSSFALERLPGYDSGHCQDNDHSAADFYWHVATPTNSAAPPTL